MPGQLYEGTIGVPTPVSVADWLAAYETSHLRVLGYVEIWSSLNAGGYSAQTLLGTYAYVSGTVKIDRSNIIRRTITDLTLLNDPDNDPSNLLLPVAGTNGGQLSPYGNEAHIFKGTMVGGVATYAAEGVFLIEEVDVINDSSGLVFKGVMNDRMEWLARLGFTYAWSGGGDGITDVSSLIDEIIANAVTPVWGPFSPFPYAGITVGYPGVFTPIANLAALQHFSVSDDPTQLMCDLASAWGSALYFDARGALNLEVVPDPYTITPCVAYTEGTSTSSIAINRAISNKAVPNVICVESGGTKATPGCTVWWWDSYPGDPAFYAAAPGDWTMPQTILPVKDPTSTYPMEMEKFTTNIQQGDPTGAQAMALAIGLTSIGSLEKATFTLRDQPAHDVDDVITVQRVVAGIPASTNYVLDQVTIDLSAGGQGVQAVGRLVWTP